MSKKINPKQKKNLAKVKVDDKSLDQVAGGRMASGKTSEVTSAGVTRCCWTV
ncbi:hypothetical protein L6R52_39625 [Myxococcota bacterium]|nr:hypothetical protein [Myxococcota bacterium]